MKSRFITLILCACMTAGALAGCGQSGESAGTDTAAQVTAEDAGTEESKVSEDSSDRYGPLICDLNLEDYVTLGEYKGLSVSMGDVEPTEEELEDAIMSDLESVATDEEVTGRTVSSGDIVNIDYVGKKDGVAFDGGTAQGYDLTIGSHTFIDGFEDGLIGAEIGEVRDLNLTFPENYGSQDLAGADVIFTVSVNSIKEKKIPELTDELANAFNEDASNIEEYRELKKEELQAQKESDAENNIKGSLVDMAVANAQIKEIPDGLLNELVDIELKRAQSYADSVGIPLEDFIQQYYGQPLETFKEEYKEIGKAGAEQILVIFAIAKAEDMIDSVEDCRTELEGYMADFGHEDFDEFMNDLDGRYCYEYIHFNKIVDFLYDNADIE